MAEEAARSAAAPAAASCARRRTCSTPGSARRSGPSRRSAGPTTPPSCAPSTRPSFLTTAREILFLWVARMIMTGIEFAGDVPFRDVYVHSVIQARDGRRMSKSLGTGIDPLEEIDRHGADALRFGLLAMSSTQDVRFSDAKVQQGARPRQQALERLATDSAECQISAESAAHKFAAGPSSCGGRQRDDRPEPVTVEDRWILSRLEAHDRLGDGEAGGLRLRPRGPGGLRLLLVRALRLVPGDRQAAALRRRGGGLGDAALGARAHAGAAAPDHAVRHRGDLVLPPGAPGAPRGAPLPAAGRVAARPDRQRPRCRRGSS